MGERRLKFWGWGYEDQQMPEADMRAAVAAVREHLGFGAPEPLTPARIEDIDLPAPRLEPPGSLAAICSSTPYERVVHAYGKAYRDLVRAFAGRIDHPPDVVAHPQSAEDVERVLEWANEAGAAAIPFGGGTSVVGGVEPRLDGGYSGAVTIDLRAMDRVSDVDRDSMAARIQAGASGPVLEDQLREQGLTLRHFPGSFEMSTLGGWIATRAGGHFSTLYTHIDDLVQSVSAITPQGRWESRRLPGSGAGPSPDRMLIGSEGTLGVITDAWVRVRERPRFKASAGIEYATFERGARAVREISQSGLHPAGCRLLDEGEAVLNGATDGKALLLLGFESAGHPVDAGIERAVELAGDHGGELQGAVSSGEVEGGAASWRSNFMQQTYIRDTLIRAGVLVETFETAITWDRFEGFISAVREATTRALGEDLARVTCRLTHVYPDGAAPYFTVLAPARPGSELEQWDEVKAAASEAIESGGGTITHHHAVGRDHRPWYDRQRPGLFADALRAAKTAVDPAWTLNPGVLVDRDR